MYNYFKALNTDIVFNVLYIYILFYIMYYIHIVKRFRAHCGFYAIENKLLLLLLYRVLQVCLVKCGWICSGSVLFPTSHCFSSHERRWLVAWNYWSQCDRCICSSVPDCIWMENTLNHRRPLHSFNPTPRYRSLATEGFNTSPRPWCSFLTTKRRHAQRPGVDFWPLKDTCKHNVLAKNSGH